MKAEEYDFLVFIGRFRPFHHGHRSIIDKALSMAKNVIVLVGSSFQEPTLKNPWTFEEVRTMIHSLYDPYKVLVFALEDCKDDDNKWTNKVAKIIEGIVESLNPSYNHPVKIALIGHMKDESSYYLKLFPKWKKVIIEGNNGINATDIRSDMFKGLELTTYQLPIEILRFINRWKLNYTYGRLLNEFKELDIK